MVLSEELFKAVCDYTRLGKKARFESAASKALRAPDAAKECAPGSLIHIVALLWHAEFLVAQALNALDHLNETREGREWKSAERVRLEHQLCETAYTSIEEALRLLFASPPLLPGSVPAAEAAFEERLVEATEPDVPPARRVLRGQRLGYAAYLQAACLSITVLFPAVFNIPYPTPNTDGVNRGRSDIQRLMDCVLQGLQWLGESVNPLQSTLIQWLPPCAVVDEGKMCTYVDQLLCPRMEDGTPFADLPAFGEIRHLRLLVDQLDSPFRRAIAAIWNGPGMRARRLIYQATAGVLTQEVQSMAASIAAADRQRMFECARPGCPRVESCIGAFKKCGACRAARYCSAECQGEHWRSRVNGHKRECRAAVAAQAAAGEL